MKRVKHILITVLLLSGALLMKSCINEDPGPGPVGPEGETAEVTFLTGTPAATAVATRGEVGTINENDIENIYVLAFDKSSGNLIYKSKGKNLTPVTTSENRNTHTFSATMPVGTEYTFMVIANAESELSGIEVSKTSPKKKADVLALTKTNTSKWNSATPFIPMWGEQDLNLTASSTPTFELTRMLARVNVEVKLRNDAQGNPKKNFKLTSVHYYNYNTSGALVPAAGNYDFTAKQATTPTIPPTPGTQTGSAIVYDDLTNEIIDGKSCKETIYIFEARQNGKTYKNPTDNSDWIDNPCLVIGGIYTTDAGVELEETFYRVDFIKKKQESNGTVTDEWLDILRNFSYNVTIAEVSGSGFTTPDIALRSAPINMEAIVLEWDEGDMGEIVFDGTFYLSVSRDEFVFERGEVNDEYEDYTLYVKTDYVYDNQPGHENSGWYVEKYVDGADGTTPVNWLQLNPDHGDPEVRVKAHFTFEENPNNVNRTAIVWIAAGRLRYPVYVTQRVLSLYITDPDNNNEQVERMDFVVPANLNPQSPRKFDVTWTPVDHNVTITMESPEVWNPFAPSWLSPDPDFDQSMTIPANPDGKQSYTITPPTVDQSAIDLDPFYQKETTYNFTVSNGLDSETKGITLHQIYYNIIVDTYSYDLDGKTYTLSVRSNTDWRIKHIEEWLYNQDPSLITHPSPILLNINNYDNLRVGTTGGPNISGESVAFTVVDREQSGHENKWGTVYVTFENPDGKFDDVRVPLRFPQKSLRVLGMGISSDVRPYNLGIPALYHTNSAYNLVTNQANFGELSESTVYARNLFVVGGHCPGVSGSSNAMVAWRTQDLKNYLNDNPDIVVVSYSMLLNSTEAKLIVDYINNGGAAIMFTGGYNDAGGSYAQNFLRALFPNDTSLSCRRVGPTGTSSVYKIPEGSKYENEPVFAGPFKVTNADGTKSDLRGQYWGVHHHAVGFTTNNQDTKDQIEVLNYGEDCVFSNSDTGMIVGFRHKTKNVIWFGCDTFMAAFPREGENSDVRYAYFDPFYIDTDLKPAMRTGFKNSGVSTLYNTCNSYMLANMMAWAISVTNHTPPTTPY